MRTKIRYLLPTLLLLASCSGLLLKPTSDDAANLPTGVRMVIGSLDSSTGCTLDYRIYTSDGQDTDELVVLAHGFLRSQARMQTLAASLAAAGHRVATLDFCNAKPWDGRHAQNALDMIALARHLDGRRVVYAGFSAGGLAAVIAGRSDRNSIGVVTLDLVETQGLGVRAARELGKPLLALAGEPTNCNALDNGRAVVAATDWGRVQRIGGAGHCDFEAPTDELCELLCSDPDANANANGTAPKATKGATDATDSMQLTVSNSARERIIASTQLAVTSLFDGDLLAWPRQL